MSEDEEEPLVCDICKRVIVEGFVYEYEHGHDVCGDCIERLVKEYMHRTREARE